MNIEKIAKIYWDITCGKDVPMYSSEGCPNDWIFKVFFIIVVIVGIYLLYTMIKDERRKKHEPEQNINDKKDA